MVSIAIWSGAFLGCHLSDHEIGLSGGRWIGRVAGEAAGLSPPLAWKKGGYRVAVELAKVAAIVEAAMFGSPTGLVGGVIKVAVVVRAARLGWP